MRGQQKLATRWQYISFDVFDTLIKRSVAIPSDLFHLMERYVDDAWQGVPKDFAEKRIRAEQQCAQKTGKPTTLVGIYQELSGEFGMWTQRLMELEIEMEFDGCRPMEEGVEQFRRCVELGKTVLLISDMYLSSETIKRMLMKCGIDGYEKLYVSCEAGVSKQDGGLYQQVLKELGIHPADLFHMGDSWRSDCVIPNALGIRTKHIQNPLRSLCRVPKRIQSEEALSYRTLAKCIANCSGNLSVYERQGVKIFGPLLVGFTSWLAKRLREDGITDVYFMSRDGYTMKQAFDSFEIGGIQTHYMYCSRRSFVTPLLWKHSSLEEIREACGLDDVNQMTIRRLLQVVGLHSEHYSECAGRFGLNIDRLYTKSSIFMDDQVRAFYEEIRVDVETNSREEYKALLSYIQSLHMNGTIAVVDIGYYGTMQNALVELLREEQFGVKVKGYYVGVCPTAPLVRSGKINAAGYLYDVGKNESYFTDYSSFNAIFETLFLAPHGSVRRFVMSDGHGVPEFDAYEYNDLTGQKVDEILVVRAYQSGAQKLVTYIHKVMPRLLLDVNAVTAIDRLAQMGTKPTIDEARLWGNFRFYSGGIQYIACPRGWCEYILHPRLLVSDFQTTLWKIGFLKRLFLLPLPYRKIIETVKKLYWNMHERTKQN